ncbi:MAG: hypothetical protein A3B70_08410 [Deltaproteobacteria bacterium RIFCSPHIGHO2_02_FULL_40_11]|nr:MAG: hypothetical protein A3B70_08410 [Deltaproteobacteria bacterium RIFCSPHIGHO2_02_FULL_40_11]
MLCVLSIIFFISQNFSYAGLDDCEHIFDASKNNVVDLQLEIEKEAYDLKALLDPKHSLAVSHPLMVMNAAQRILSLIYFGGMKEVAYPLSPDGKVRMYPVFSQGSRLTDGRLIIGQLAEIDELMEVIKTNGYKLPLLLGPHGTGKSEILEILALLAKNLTTLHPDFYMYDFGWQNLSTIPALQAELLKIGDHENVRMCPMHDSPFTLLPKDVQEGVLTQAQERVLALSGQSPAPVREPCVQCQYIRGKVLQHYATEKLGKLKPEDREILKRLKGLARFQTLSSEDQTLLSKLQKKGELSSEEILEALNRHTVVRRMVIDSSRGSAPIVDAQPQDTDWNGLIAAPHGLMRDILGPSHPLAWHFNGKFLGGNGNVIFLDEVLQNADDFRKFLLRTLQARTLDQGGMPKTPFDAVMIAASNTATRDKIVQDPNNVPQLDRMWEIMFNYSVIPHEIAKLMVHFVKLKGVTVWQQKLSRSLAKEEASDGAVSEVPTEGVAQHAVELANLEQLFPMVEPGKALQGPDGRYKYWAEKEGRRIHVSPHTILFMADVAAASRIVTDVKAAERQLSDTQPHAILRSMLFRDLVTRLKVYQGLDRPLDSELEELKELRIKLKEGDQGISSRDVEKWLDLALSQATRSENHFCLTPQIAIRVFRDLLNRGTIKAPNLKTRLQWEKYMQVVGRSFLVPDIQTDINVALSRDTGLVDATYEEILYEMMALNDDPSATRYTNRRTNQKRAINAKRLDVIRNIYLSLKGRPLAIQQIALQHLRSWDVTTKPEEIVQDPGLKESIVKYLSDKTMEVVSLPDLVQFSDTQEGTDQTRQAWTSFQKVMIDQLGYCPTCLKHAMDFAMEAASKQGQAAPPHKH